MSWCYDHIIALEPGISLAAKKLVSRAAVYFADHFPDNPVLPMTIWLECTLNLAKEFVALSEFTAEYSVVALKKVKMNSFVRPGDVVISYLVVKTLDAAKLVISCRSEVDGKRIGVMDVIFQLK